MILVRVVCLGISVFVCVCVTRFLNVCIHSFYDKRAASTHLSWSSTTLVAKTIMTGGNKTSLSPIQIFKKKVFTIKDFLDQPRATVA